ncbi:MAG: hypothetical protein HRU50_03600 [Winogradskyella sp.]|uniref:hypothetical protein n=1 Tax=Winogradskyella sp. TaxID=1883156 RepID=UPI0025D44332|nr:hypothetical protein [Winogradskyella sp.]NRB59011.1 hypothetical protein [Winogradskyella sp.]
MGLGAGHVLDMVNRMKQNRSMRPSNRKKFKDNRESIRSASKHSSKLSFKEVSTEQLNKVKEKIRSEAALRRRKERFIYVLGFLIAFFVIFFIIKWIN